MALRVEETERSGPSSRVSGQVNCLSILIETCVAKVTNWRVSRPEVILRTVDGELQEPFKPLLWTWKKRIRVP